MHTRNIEKYGGLIGYMPATAICFLVGSIAISGLPPFNGFFSEWITFQTMFAGIALGTPIKFLFALTIASLAFGSGLASACFVKTFGAVFLARPRSDAVLHTEEVSSVMKISMAVLAGLTLVIGFFAGNIMHILQTILTDMGRFNQTLLPGSFALKSVQVHGFAVVSMPAIFLTIIVSFAVATLLIEIASRKQKNILGLTWNGGTTLTRRIGSAPISFLHSILVVTHGALRPLDIYQKIDISFVRASQFVRRFHTGNGNLYVLYILLAFVALMTLVVF